MAEAEGNRQASNRDEHQQSQEEVFEVTEEESPSSNGKGPDIHAVPTQESNKTSTDNFMNWKIAVDKPETPPSNSSNGVISNLWMPTKYTPDNRLRDDGEMFANNNSIEAAFVPSRRRSRINKFKWKNVFYKEKET